MHMTFLMVSRELLNLRFGLAPHSLSCLIYYEGTGLDSLAQSWLSESAQGNASGFPAFGRGSLRLGLRFIQSNSHPGISGLPDVFLLLSKLFSH